MQQHGCMPAQIACRSICTKTASSQPFLVLLPKLRHNVILPLSTETLVRKDATVYRKRRLMLQAPPSQAAGRTQASKRLCSQSSFNPDVPVDAEAVSCPFPAQSESSLGSNLANLAAAVVAANNNPQPPISTPSPTFPGSKAAATPSHSPLGPLSEANAFISGRKQPKRLVVNSLSDLLHFSAKHVVTSPTGIHEHARRWHHNARGGVSSAAAAARNGTSGPNTARSTGTHSQASPTAMQSGEVGGVTSTPPPAPQEQVTYPLPLAADESPFTGDSRAIGDGK
jgi:hypothetical protein